MVHHDSINAFRPREILRVEIHRYRHGRIIARSDGPETRSRYAALTIAYRAATSWLTEDHEEVESLASETLAVSRL